MISAGVKPSIKEQEMKDLVAAIYKLFIIRITFKISNTMGYSRKKNRGIQDILFENPLEFFVHLLYLPLEILHIIQSSTPGNCAKKIELHPLEIPRPKTKTPGNSTSFFLGHLWKSYMLFL